MKRTIKKSELRRLVESALNEISWNTAYNVGAKRYDMGEDDKANRDFDFAGEKFAKQYGLKRNGVYMDADHGNFDGNDKWGYDVNTARNGGGWYNRNKYDFIEDAEEDDPYMESGDWGNYDDSFGYAPGKSRDAFYDMVNTITESVIRRLRRR